MAALKALAVQLLFMCMVAQLATCRPVMEGMLSILNGSDTEGPSCFLCDMRCL